LKQKERKLCFLINNVFHALGDNVVAPSERGGDFVELKSARVNEKHAVATCYSEQHLNKIKHESVDVIS
jgi:hypothetical protein